METTDKIMIQYFKIKEQYPDVILFFKVGDFFRSFGEDAKIVSKILSVPLESVDNVLTTEFPGHAPIDTYMIKFIRAGYRVAICKVENNVKTKTKTKSKKQIKHN